MNRIVAVVVAYAISMAGLVIAAAITVSSLSNTGRGLFP